MQFRHITIVGVGLIGGSFALAARRAGIAKRITGSDRKEVLDEALDRGVIDQAEDAFESGLACDADLVYLAAPVGAIVSFLRTRGNSLKEGTIVTDAGSTKREICRVARKTLPSHVRFVGGHPMAGSHNSGVAHADAELFRDAPYALVVENPKGEPPDELRAVEEVVLSIGARPVMVSAAEHDRTVARVSHAPQLLATAMACAVARRLNDSDVRLAGSGFFEMVRLAASRWSMWEDICRTNADEIAAALDEVISEMEAARSIVAGGELEALGMAFDDANDLVRGLGPRGDSRGSLVD